MKSGNNIRKFLFLLIFMPLVAFSQWDDCVHGEENCEYPGDCGSYIDTNKDQICDHSQPEPAQPASFESSVEEKNETAEEIQDDDDQDLVTGQEVKTMSVSEVALVYGIDENEYATALSDGYGKKIKATDEFQLLHDNFGVQPSDAKNIADGLAVVSGAQTQQKTVVSKEEKVESKEQSKSRYNLILTTVVLLVAYFVTWFLVQKEKIKQFSHRRFWNVLLFVNFLLSGISGILLVIKINYGVAFAFPFNLLKLHVETGIAMAIITIFHIAWHWKYFKIMFKKN